MSEILAMCVFALTMSMPPGPANVIILSIGMNYGSRAALPFVFGATVGFVLLLFLIGLGLERLARQAGNFLEILNYIGLAFIFYLGLKIAFSKASIMLEERSIPGFMQGFVLQWLNPKAWAACLAGIAVFNTAESQSKLLLFVSLYFVVCFFGIGAWAVLGQSIYGFLKSERNLRMFNALMGGGLMLVALALLVG